MQQITGKMFATSLQSASDLANLAATMANLFNFLSENLTEGNVIPELRAELARSHPQIIQELGRFRLELVPCYVAIGRLENLLWLIGMPEPREPAAKRPLPAKQKGEDDPTGDKGR